MKVSGGGRGLSCGGGGGMGSMYRMMQLGQSLPKEGGNKFFACFYLLERGSTLRNGRTVQCAVLRSELEKRTALGKLKNIY